MKHLVAAVLAALALSKDYAAFPTGAVQHLLTKDELRAWKSVQTDEQAKAFIALFWARRDPTPATPSNEFREAIEARIKTADANFGEARLAGSASERGKVFVLLGSPAKIRKTEKQSSTLPTGPQAMPRDLGELDTDANRSAQTGSAKELWSYDQSKTSVELGQPNVDILFIDQYESNEWKLDKVPTTNHTRVFEKVALSYITQPELKEATVFAAAAPVLAFRNAALGAAIDELRAGKAAAVPDLFVSWGEFVTPAGAPFVPVQLYAPGRKGGEKGTFFGRIDRADSGEAVSVFEEPATLTATSGGAYVDASLALPPGEYRATFGFAGEGKPPALVSTPIAVTGLDKDAAGVSALILSNDLHAMKEAQSPTDPYAFGGLKVVPKSDRVFQRADELWYFFELRNPGIDPATKEPRLLVRLTLTGKTDQGAPVKIVGAAEETPARELKGAAGRWAIGQSLPLESFEPGEYAITLRVTDLTTKQGWDLAGPFRIVR